MLNLGNIILRKMVFWEKKLREFKNCKWRNRSL